MKVSLLNNQFKENRNIFKLFWKYSTHVFVTVRFAKHIFLASDVAGVTILLHRRHLYEFFRRARVNARRAPGARGETCPRIEVLTFLLHSSVVL